MLEESTMGMRVRKFLLERVTVPLIVRFPFIVSIVIY